MQSVSWGHLTKLHSLPLCKRKKKIHNGGLLQSFQELIFCYLWNSSLSSRKWEEENS